MRVYLSLLLILILMTVGCKSETTEEYFKGTRIEISEVYIKAFTEGDFDGMYSNFLHDSAMKKAVDAKGYEKIWEGLVADYGDFIELKEVRESTLDGYDIVTIRGVFTNADLNLNVVFNQDKEIAGFNYTFADQEGTFMEGTLEVLAKHYIALMSENEFESITKELKHSQEMLAAVSPSIYESIWAEILEKYGSYKEILSFKERSQGVFRIVALKTQFENQQVTINVVFDQESAISGLNYFPYEDAVEGSWVEETIIFGTEKFPITGTLTLPEGEKKFPLIILVHGSGPNDRDETIGPNKPFRDIAYAMAEAGIATLRYDKRTYTHGTSIDVSTFTIDEETVDDAVEAFRNMQSNDSIDPQRIYVLGHSLGGYMLPKIALGIPEAKGFICVAGTVSPLHKIIPMQYNYIFNLDGTYTESERDQLEKLNVMEKNIDQLSETSTYVASELMGIAPAYWLSLKDYDPIEPALKIPQPLWIVGGSMDYQVPYDEFVLWQEGLKDRKNTQFTYYEGLNHLMMKAEGIPSPDMYNIPGHVDEKFLKDLSLFIE